MRKVFWLWSLALCAALSLGVLPGRARAEEVDFGDCALILRITGREEGAAPVGFAADREGRPERLEEGQIGPEEGNGARLLFSDGAVRDVELDRNYLKDLAVGDGVTSHPFAAGTVVLYREEGGQYMLREYPAPGAIYYRFTDFNIRDGITIGVISSDHHVIEFGNRTKFVVNYDGEYRMYHGVRNVPDVARGSAYICEGPAEYDRGSWLEARVVFVVAGTVVEREPFSVEANNVTFLAGKSVSKKIWALGEEDHYVYNGVVNGETAAVKVAEEQITVDGHITLLKPGGRENRILNRVQYNSTGQIVWGDFDREMVDGSGVAEGVSRDSDCAADEIWIDTWNEYLEENTGRGRLMAVAEDTKVFYVDYDGNISEIAFADIPEDEGRLDVYYTFDHVYINNLFLVERERIEKPAVKPVVSSASAEKTLGGDRDGASLGLSLTVDNGGAAGEIAVWAALYDEAGRFLGVRQKTLPLETGEKTYDLGTLTFPGVDRDAAERSRVFLTDAAALPLYGAMI